MALEIGAYVRDIPDFPEPGIIFKDIAPLLGNAAAFAAAVEEMAQPLTRDIDVIAAIDARGFLFGAAMATAHRKRLVPIRKAGKLPGDCERVTYDLEYGSDSLEMQSDALVSSERVLIVDDVLATGGTANATATLVEKAGGVVAGFSFLIGLDFLPGRSLLEPRAPIATILRYE